MEHPEVKLVVLITLMLIIFFTMMTNRGGQLINWIILTYTRRIVSGFLTLIAILLLMAAFNIF